MEYLKRADKTPKTETATARKVVEEMLAEIERRGEPAVRDYAAKLDRWTGEIVVTREELERRTASISKEVKRDIDFATAQVRRFAQAQRDSMQEFSRQIRSNTKTGRSLIDSPPRRPLRRANRVRSICLSLIARMNHAR